MKAPRAAVLVVAIVGILGLSSGLVLGARSATPIAGAWRGGGHLLQISGTLESGFSVAAGESWTIIGCPINRGDVLSRYTPKGGSSYTAYYLWTENENGTCSSSTRGPENVTVVLSSPNSLSITGCGYAFCGSLTRVGAAPGTTSAKTTTKSTTTTSTRTSTTRDTSPPHVVALTKGITRPATRAKLNFRVSDDSGQARVTVTLFEGGTQISHTTSGWGPANGSAWWWNALMPSDMVGPAYFCVQAVDKAGNQSATRCAWISLVAPIEKVSNGCGGGGWDALVATQNYFGNKHTYWQSLARSYTVDFHTWSRPHIDRKFLGDMRKLCDRQIPRSAPVAREKCYSTGGSLSIGALALYNFVNKFGWRFFDADLTKPGLQPRGHRANF